MPTLTIPDLGAAGDGDMDRNMILGSKFFVTPVCVYYYASASVRFNIPMFVSLRVCCCSHAYLVLFVTLIACIAVGFAGRDCGKRRRVYSLLHSPWSERMCTQYAHE